MLNTYAHKFLPVRPESRPQHVGSCSNARLTFDLVESSLLATHSYQILYIKISNEFRSEPIPRAGLVPYWWDVGKRKTGGPHTICLEVKIVAEANKLVSLDRPVNFPYLDRLVFIMTCNISLTDAELLRAPTSEWSGSGEQFWLNVLPHPQAWPISEKGLIYIQWWSQPTSVQVPATSAPPLTTTLGLWYHNQWHNLPLKGIDQEKRFLTNWRSRDLGREFWA